MNRAAICLEGTGKGEAGALGLGIGMWIDEGLTFETGGSTAERQDPLLTCCDGRTIGDDIWCKSWKLFAARTTNTQLVTRCTPSEFFRSMPVETSLVGEAAFKSYCRVFR